jgi:O-antigen ligase
LPFALPFAVVGLVAVVAWGVGGYEPWAGFVLQLGALALGGVVFFRIVFRTSREERERNVRLRRSQKRASADVEFLDPSSGEPVGGPFREPYLWMGYPFRGKGGLALLLAATIWVGLSLVPLPPSLLSMLSPKAFALKSEAHALFGREIGWASWSVTPFLTIQDLLLWLAYVLIFFVVFHLVDSSRAMRRLAVALLLLGIASGGYGLFQWLVALGAGEEEGLRAAGSFGNRNHYAMFQEMLFLIGLGWVQMRWQQSPRRAPDRTAAQEEKAKLSLFAVGVALVGLSLLFSLSRSGITFTAAGCALFFYLTRARRTSLVFASALAAVALWIGIDPIVSRFELIPDEVAGEAGRSTVWRDSAGALQDFWLTGSGLSSFQHVYPIYRSFGGRRFFSWAHNDYLQIGIELGLPGLLLTLAAIFWVARRARRTRAALVESGSSFPVLHAGFCAGALAVALHSFTDFGLHLPANAALFAVVLAVVVGMSPPRVVRKPAHDGRKTLRRAPPSV